MFENVQALDARQHADLRFTGVAGFAFARDVTHAPLSASEVGLAARYFPIVFTGTGRLVPQALMSVRKGVNPFVRDDGSWRVDYVPAHIRRYPFVLGETGQAERYVVMIDRAAPQFASGEGDPLFDADGKEAEGGIVQRAKEFLTRFQRELIETERMLAPLEEHKLLVSRRIDVTRDGKTETAVHGFRLIDTERLAGLDDAVLAGWVRSGLMALIHAHLLSLNNTQSLLKRDAEVATASAPANGGNGAKPPSD